MSTLTHREFRGPFMDVFDWLESPWTMLRPAASHPLRMEDYVEDGTYVLRAELPGVSTARSAQLVAGALVAEAALELFEIDRVQICPWALREGVILRRLDGIKE